MLSCLSSLPWETSSLTWRFYVLSNTFGTDKMIIMAVAVEWNVPNKSNRSTELNSTSCATSCSCFSLPMTRSLSFSLPMTRALSLSSLFVCTHDQTSFLTHLCCPWSSLDTSSFLEHSMNWSSWRPWGSVLGSHNEECLNKSCPLEITSYGTFKILR